MWIFLLCLSAHLCQRVDTYNLSYGQHAAQLTTGLIIISGPRLKPSFDLNHLSSPWALHLIEWGLGNHGAVCQTYWYNIAAWIMAAVIYSGITGISVAVLLNCHFQCCSLIFLFVPLFLGWPQAAHQNWPWFLCHEPVVKNKYLDPL